jgi:hypothetical protein
MMRRFGLAATLILASSLTLLAQDHQGAHPQGHPHGRTMASIPNCTPRCMRRDVDRHVTSANGPETMNLVAANASDGRLTLSLTSDSAHFGPASGVTITGNAVRWAQALADQSCTAGASFAAARKAVTGDAERIADLFR